MKNTLSDLNNYLFERLMENRIKTCATLMVTLLAVTFIGLYGAVCEELREAAKPKAEAIGMTSIRMPEAEPAQSLAAAAQADKPAWTTICCRIYHYCECDRCTGKHEGDPAYGITATGTLVCEGRTVAVDPAVIPLGSEVWINGHTYIAEDTGVHGEAVDIYVPNHEKAVRMGTYETIVKWR